MKKIPHTIKLVVFDLDGTLVDAYQAITDSINFMMQKMGQPAQSHRSVKRSVGWGVDSLVSCFVPPEQVPEALQWFRSHHDRRLQKDIKLLGGAKSILPYLQKQGCILAIASNRPTKFCHIILKALDIDHYFDHVICGDKVKRPKPYPDMLQVILQKTGIRPSEAVYVGDMSVDILCGRRARVFTVAVPTGSCTRAQIMAAKPGRVIERLTELKDLFKGKGTV